MEGWATPPVAKGERKEREGGSRKWEGFEGMYCTLASQKRRHGSYETKKAMQVPGRTEREGREDNDWKNPATRGIAGRNLAPGRHPSDALGKSNLRSSRQSPAVPARRAPPPGWTPRHIAIPCHLACSHLDSFSRPLIWPLI